MKIAPSILTANFNHLKAEIDSVMSADLLHIDIMDGHFVPNISFGPAITKSVSKLSKIPLDVHLMVEKPCDWIEAFHFENTKYITVHYESKAFNQALQMIRERGLKAGLSIKPKTDVSVLIPYLYHIDLVLIMTVEPGFGGQRFIEDMLKKVRFLKDYKTKYNLYFEIEVDGGINDKTILDAKASGVDICVVGSHLFNQKDRDKGIRDLS